MDTLDFGQQNRDTEERMQLPGLSARGKEAKPFWKWPSFDCRGWRINYHNKASGIPFKTKKLLKRDRIFHCYKREEKRGRRGRLAQPGILPKGHQTRKLGPEGLPVTFVPDIPHTNTYKKRFEWMEIHSKHNHIKSFESSNNSRLRSFNARARCTRVPSLGPGSTGRKCK